MAATEQERTLRLECSDAYKRLYTQYRQTAQDLHDTSSKYVSSQRQLNEASEAISTYVSTIEDYERRLANSVQMAEHEAARATQLECTVRKLEDYERRLANSVQMAEHEAARATQLESTVRKLEEEKVENAQKLQEYQVALKYAANRLNADKQKISELEKEKEGMVQDHQVAVATAAYRISELEQNSISVETPTTEKRQRPDEASHKNGPATRGRKRRAVMQNGKDSDAARL
jgi:chromosome segregation ATPase